MSGYLSKLVTRSHPDDLEANKRNFPFWVKFRFKERSQPPYCFLYPLNFYAELSTINILACPENPALPCSNILLHLCMPCTASSSALMSSGAGSCSCPFDVTVPGPASSSCCMEANNPWDIKHGYSRRLLLYHCMPGTAHSALTSRGRGGAGCCRWPTDVTTPGPPSFS